MWLENLHCRTLCIVAGMLLHKFRLHAYLINSRYEAIYHIFSVPSNHKNYSIESRMSKWWLWNQEQINSFRVAHPPSLHVVLCCQHVSKRSWVAFNSTGKPSAILFNMNKKYSKAHYARIKFLSKNSKILFGTMLQKN